MQNLVVFLLSLLFEDGQLDTLALRQRNHRLVAGTNGENVRESGGKVWPAASVKWTTSKEPCAFRLLTIPTRPAFLPPVTMHKAPASNLTKSVILLEAMSTMTESPSLIIGSVSDGSRVVQLHARNALVAQLLLDHLAQLVLRFNTGDSVHDKSTFLVVHQTEVFVRLFNIDNVHDTARIALLHWNFTVNLDQALLKNRRDFLVVQRVLQTVSQDQAQRRHSRDLCGLNLLHSKENDKEEMSVYFLEFFLGVKKRNFVLTQKS